VPGVDAKEDAGGDCRIKLEPRVVEKDVVQQQQQES
jgi:hypothetical protein